MIPVYSTIPTFPAHPIENREREGRERRGGK